MRTIIRALPRRTKFLRGKDSLIVGYPWLTYGAIMALEQIEMSNFEVLEFGSGGSTLFFARRCLHVYSHETNSEWAEQVREAVVDRNNVMVECDHLSDIEFEIQRSGLMYDLVLVDHKDDIHRHTDRLPLAMAAVPRLKVGGWLVVDNYNAFGMNRFDYSAPMWDVYTFDDVRWKGRGTRLCKKLA
jgi:hypothetical protein